MGALKKKHTSVFFFYIYILKNISLDITKTVLRPSVSERKALPLFWNIFRFLPFFFKDANFEPYNLARLFIVTFEIFRSEKMPIDVVEQSCWEMKSDSICSIDFDVLVLYNQFFAKTILAVGVYTCKKLQRRFLLCIKMNLFTLF